MLFLEGSGWGSVITCKVVTTLSKLMRKVYSSNHPLRKHIIAWKPNERRELEKMSRCWVSFRKGMVLGFLSQLSEVAAISSGSCFFISPGGLQIITAITLRYAQGDTRGKSKVAPTLSPISPLLGRGNNSVFRHRPRGGSIQPEALHDRYDPGS